MRRPVKGGPARQGRKEMDAQRYRAGGPGVLWTPGRRPLHRNGGARRLSGYAAKSRSDAPTGGAQASPFPCFRPPYRRPMQKGWGLALPPYSHERTTIIREVVEKKAAKLSRQVSCTATPARPIKRKCSAGGAGGCGDSRGARGAGRPASRFLQRGGHSKVRGCPESGECRQARWANKEKSSVSGGGGCGNSRKMPAPRQVPPYNLPKQTARKHRGTPQRSGLPRRRRTRNTRRETKKTT